MLDAAPFTVPGLSAARKTLAPAAMNAGTTVCPRAPDPPVISITFSFSFTNPRSFLAGAAAAPRAIARTVPQHRPAERGPHSDRGRFPAMRAFAGAGPNIGPVLLESSSCDRDPRR